MIQNISANTKHCIRRAVTLVEVIFAVGVVLIGLLGLMSILPLAGRRAEDALALNTGAALAESVIDELISRKFVSNNQLLPFSTTASVNPRRDSYVIDPLFCSGYEFQNTRITGTISSNSAYQPSIFPFYKQRYNPRLDPSASASVNWTDDQPRLYRVGVVDFGGASNHRFIDFEQALALTESVDDLNVIRPDDRTRPSTFGALATGGLQYGKRVPKGRYSWFATVNPFVDRSVSPVVDAEYASVSVVIVLDRERNFEFQLNDQAVQNAEENRLDERVCYVTTANGFQNGAGGLVTLTASNAVESTLKSNDWLMLSRTTTAGTFHRWYRVSSVSGKATPDTSTTWQLQVSLDGPDWEFGFNGTADNTVGDNTYATLVKGVVSVTERTVLMNDL